MSEVLLYRLHPTCTYTCAVFSTPMLQIIHFLPVYILLVNSLVHLSTPHYICYRRRAQFGMLEEPYTSRNDADIIELIRQIHSESPNLGVSMVSGRFRARGFKV